MKILILFEYICLQTINLLIFNLIITVIIKYSLKRKKNLRRFTFKFYFKALIIIKIYFKQFIYL